ncbi:MAG: sensor histidine kinase, partial [Bacteroidota bacterium]
TTGLKNIHISGLSHGSNYIQFRVRAPGLPEERWPSAAMMAEAALPLTQRGIFKVFLLFLAGALVLSVLSWFKRRQREKVLLNQLDQTRLSTVQAQLNPHILFNLLSSLQNSVANRSREEASDHLIRISRLIRDTLEISISSSENAKAPFPVISVSKEADFLRNYLGLEAMQQNPPFLFDVKVQFSVSPDLVSIPPLLVQPLVENAVIHGVRPAMNKRCSIEVEFRDEAENIIVSVTDDGVGIANSIRSSTLRYRSRGSELLEKRLSLLGKLGFPASISVRQRDTGGTIAEITIKKIVCESFS